MAKESKKWMKTLKNNGFRSPYQVLVDDSFLRAAEKHCIKFPTIKDILKGEPKLYMSKCTYELHRSHQSQHDFSGECKIIDCGHPTHNTRCPHEFIGDANLHHYILATGNARLIGELKHNKHIPVLRTFKGTLKIECFQMNPSSGVYTGQPARKKELRNLKRMFG